MVPHGERTKNIDLQDMSKLLVVDFVSIVVDFVVATVLLQLVRQKSISACFYRRPLYLSFVLLLVQSRCICGSFGGAAAALERRMISHDSVKECLFTYCVSYIRV